MSDNNELNIMINSMIIEGDEYPEETDNGKEPAEDDSITRQYKYVEDQFGAITVFQMLSRNEIPRLYWSLENYNPDIISDELKNIIMHDDKLIDILQHPVENRGDFLLLMSFLNEKQNPAVEEIRVEVYELVLKMCGEKFEELPEIQALLPPSGLSQLCNEIMTFYQEYDPYQLKEEKLGWGQIKEDALKPDKTLNYHNADFSPIFRDLHAVAYLDATPRNRKIKANDLIDSLRKYAHDPVPDRVYVLYAKPRRNGELVLIENSYDSFNGVAYYIQGEQIRKPIGNNILAISQRNAKAKELPKNRTIVKTNGDVLGIARGPLVFLAIDEKENIVPMTEAQKKWVHKKYFDMQTFETYPVDSDRAKELLENIFSIISASEKDAHSAQNKLRSFGFKISEIENFKRYHQEKWGSSKE